MMATFTGATTEAAVFCEPTIGKLIARATGLTEHGTGSQDISTGTVASLKTPRQPVTTTGTHSHNYVRDQIHNRIWLTPLTIEAGFILEDIGYEISIWNAHRDKAVALTGITPVNPDGLFVERPPLPSVIWSDREQVIPVTVTSNGPAVQDLILSLTVDGIVLSVHITAMRTLLMTLEPNWNEPVSFKYSFDTIISRSETIREQRRFLLPDPVRTLSASFLTDSVEAQMLLHTLLYGHDKLIGTPVFPEPVYIAQIEPGATVITAANDITAYWNLNHLSDYLFLIDRKSGAHELIKIIAVSGQLIRLETPVTLNFSPETTTLYPLFFCVIQAAEISHHTRELDTVDITLKEFLSG